jgi:tetratricopeptide (TPR) repeat protein
MRIDLRYVSITTVVLGFLASGAAAQSNYSNIFSVSTEQMLAGVDTQTIAQLNQASRTLQANPNDVNTLVTRAVLSLNIADRSPYSFQWVHFAAKDLERAIQLDPNNFYARHNYGMANYQAGDFSDDQPNMHRAVAEFTKAIQIKPDSARSYMGRGWAYLMLDDEAHANTDFQKALQIDPSLRDQLARVADGIRQKRSQKNCVKGMMARMGSYVVNRNARNYNQCTAARGFWTGSECRISTAMAPGPLALDAQNTATASPAWTSASCAPPPNALDSKYNARAGGYFVR